jgi:hypothetical protein
MSSRRLEIEEDPRIKKVEGLHSVVCLNRTIVNISFFPCFWIERYIPNRENCSEIWNCPKTDSPEELKLILSWIDNFNINFNLEGYPLLSAYIYLEAFYQFVSLGLCGEYVSIADSLIHAYSSCLLYCENQNKCKQERIILPHLIEEFQNSLYFALYYRERNFSYREASYFLYNERIREIFDDNETLSMFEAMYHRKKR